MHALFVLCTITFTTSVFADPTSDAAYRLLDSVNMEEAMQKNMDNMLELQLKQNPALAPYRKVLREFFQQYLSYESVKHDFAVMYMEAFTPEEMLELAAFNESELGRKANKLMPDLMARGAQLGVDRIQENQAVLTAMIQAESKRLQELSEQ